MMDRLKPSKLYDIITFGDMCVDLIVAGEDVIPEFGQVEKLVGEYELEMGGSCNIFACQAAKLGLRVGTLGRVGNDDFGRLILRRLDECGVDTRHVIIDPTVKTGLGISLIQGNDRAMLTVLGSLCAVYPEDVSDEFLLSARHLHHGSFFLHTNLRPKMPEIFRRAKSFGLTTSLDPNWDPDENWNSTLKATLPSTDLFFPNEREARFISRSQSLDEAARAFQAMGVRITAIKQGEEGALVISGQDRHDFVLPAVMGGDSVGAGDSFDAGFLAGWLRQEPLERCLQIASHCGRAVAAQVGGLRGQLDWQRILQMVGRD